MSHRGEVFIFWSSVITYCLIIIAAQTDRYAALIIVETKLL